MRRALGWSITESDSVRRRERHSDRDTQRDADADHGSRGIRVHRAVGRAHRGSAGAGRRPGARDRR